MTTAAIIGCGDVSIIHTEALADHGRHDDWWRSATPTRSGWQSLAQKHGRAGFLRPPEPAGLGATRRRAHLHPAQPARLAGHRLPGTAAST